ncbi:MULTISPECIES: SDR family oxidoreductase [unclassified Flavobacterium]|uniref:SDR family oxidoreductase n=1 Tax=unclassified Flavobacterium TaxID=196869 RepID=UPI00156F8786|nr:MULTISPECIES: SDR family oxidoreductase [unclassified Flavobacterium]NRT13097.1 uncharacterized protein YbjT (DUF2867 family) [Flavobacterium sp. 14A]NRT14483.1 uncharacterized protein YbjT (DUF2867 family) [Flavobacterium sp. 28A]
MENILVAGANGTTGKQIVALLHKSENFNPIAMVRKEEQQTFFKNQNIETVLGDLTNNVDAAFSSTIDRVIFAAGSGGKDVIGVDQEGAKKMIDASKKANVKKFVMLSSMGADKPEEATQLVEYLKAKHNADEYLKTSGLEYSIVRPGTLTNEAQVAKIELAPKLNKRGEISRADVAQTLVQALESNTATNASFEIIKGQQSITEALSQVK